VNSRLKCQEKSKSQLNSRANTFYAEFFINKPQVCPTVSRRSSSPTFRPMPHPFLHAAWLYRPLPWWCSCRSQHNILHWAECSTDSEPETHRHQQTPAPLGRNCPRTGRWRTLGLHGHDKRGDIPSDFCNPDNNRHPAECTPHQTSLDSERSSEPESVLGLKLPQQRQLNCCCGMYFLHLIRMSWWPQWEV